MTSMVCVYTNQNSRRDRMTLILKGKDEPKKYVIELEMEKDRADIFVIINGKRVARFEEDKTSIIFEPCSSYEVHHSSQAISKSKIDGEIE